MGQTHTPIHHSRVASGALSGSFARFDLKANGEGSEAPLGRIHVGVAWLSYSTELGSPSTMEWYFTQDAAGDIGLTPTKSSTITAGQTAATGFIAADIAVPWVTDSTALYLWARFSDGSTPTGTIVDAGVTWTE